MKNNKRKTEKYLQTFSDDLSKLDEEKNIIMFKDTHKTSAEALIKFRLNFTTMFYIFRLVERILFWDEMSVSLFISSFLLLLLCCFLILYFDHNCFLFLEQVYIILDNNDRFSCPQYCLPIFLGKYISLDQKFYILCLIRFIDKNC